MTAVGKTLTIFRIDMYGLPGSSIQFGVKRAKTKPGRESAQAKFLEQQKDLFPVDLYTSKLVASSQAARSNGAGRAASQGAAGDRQAARSAALPPVTNRGGKSTQGDTGTD